MKQIKKLSALAAGAVALVLLLGAGTAFAESVKVNGKGYVTKIKNLKVHQRNGSVKKYDVTFKYDSASDVYKDRGFDFSNEENALRALIAVQDALNNANPIPKRASSVGNKQFFIGVEVERNTFVAGVGAEFLSGIWDDCEKDCFAGTATGKANENFTWAKFKKINKED